MPNIVRVYHDPITMKDFEGSAKVLRIRFRNDTQCNCQVRFLAGPPPRVFDRWIDNDQLKAAGFTLPED